MSLQSKSAAFASRRTPDTKVMVHLSASQSRHLGSADVIVKARIALRNCQVSTGNLRNCQRGRTAASASAAWRRCPSGAVVVRPFHASEVCGLTASGFRSLSIDVCTGTTGLFQTSSVESNMKYTEVNPRSSERYAGLMIDPSEVDLRQI